MFKKIFDFTNSIFKSLILMTLLLVITSYSYSEIPAFPGAEGYGMYTTGGRGGQVIEVTNLNDSGAGSLRAAIGAFGARIIVFKVSGTIELNSRLEISYGNITIAGQTAPGDGICLKNYPLTVSASNVIIRYIRCRLGDEKDIEDDAMNGRNRQNIIIDHCSMSWSVDETASFYDNTNFTMQWCIVSESLWRSVHDKGNHGYGGIWGGKGASFHHNLLAHHTSRNPRFCGSRYSNRPDLEKIDHRNNVIYNWGGNSCYGAEGGSYNIVNNYYKYGPATSSSVRDRIINPDADGGGNNQPAGIRGYFYVEGNYIFGYPDVTEDNWDGGVDGASNIEEYRLDEPHDSSPVFTHKAEQAFELVLADAGVVRPIRDAIDARIVNEVRTQTTTYGQNGIIDTPSDVGGYLTYNTYDVPVDEDHDGMADDWENNNGLDSTNPDDHSGDIDGNGYTNIEDYINSLCLRDDFVLPVVQLAANVDGFASVTISWIQNAFNETGFSIERSENDTSNFVQVGTVGVNDTIYTDNTVNPASVYYYRVRSYTPSSFSISSEYILARTSNGDGSPVKAIQPAPADSAADISVIQTLGWIAGTGAESHDVYLGATNPPPFIGNFDDNNYDPRGLEEGITYYWRIDEVNGIGKSEGDVWQFTTSESEKGLNAHWEINRGYGSVALDRSGHRSHAYLKNMTADAWIAGQNEDGFALQFDGIDDYVEISNSEYFNDDIRGFTLSFWIKQNKTDLNAPIISKMSKSTDKEPGYDISHTAAGQVVFRLRDTEGGESELSHPNTEIATGEWELVTAVRDRDGKQLHLYLNGEKKKSIEDTTYNLMQSSMLYLGSDEDLTEFYEGALDDIRFYNYSLTENEVSDLYNEYFTSVAASVNSNQFKFSLSNYPNPFNPMTEIRFQISEATPIQLTVYDILGKEVTTLLNKKKMNAGDHYITWNAEGYAGGIYFVRLITQDRLMVRKMILLK